MPSETEILAGRTRFEATHWSLILSVQMPADPKYLESWNELVRHYWRPVYRAIRFRWNKPVEEAKDLTQEFFASAFEDGSVRAFTPSRGRFRTFLKASLENFLRNSHRDSNRLKRGGGATPLSLDFIDPADEPELRATDNLFDREWRRSLFEHALAELQGTPAMFNVVRQYYLDPAKPTYRQIADQLGMSEADVTNHLHQGKERLRQIVRRLVREATHTDQDYEDEMRELFGAP